MVKILKKTNKAMAKLIDSMEDNDDVRSIWHR